MSDEPPAPDPQDPLDPSAPEVEASPKRPTLRERADAISERADTAKRAVEARAEVLRGRHASVRLAYQTYERDRRQAGALLAGGIAYRLFLWLLPTALFVVGVVGLLATISSESPEARRARCRLRGRHRVDRGPGDATVREGFPLARAARRGPRAVGRSIRREGIEPDGVGRLGVAARSAHPGPREVPDLLGDLRRVDAPPRTPPHAPSGPPRHGCAARAGHSWQGWSR